jgi:rubrerythrin
MLTSRVDFERKQRLYELLKKQHEAEKHEILHYSSILKDIENNLIRNYFNTLLNDGIKHIQYITQAMSKIEGASGSMHLTKDGIDESIEEELQSRNILSECVDLAEDQEIKELIKSVVVDEEHHIQILKHVRQLIETYSKRQAK